MIAKIHNVRGYNGLPDQLLVVSRYGYLGKDSFTTLEKAIVFKTKEKAIEELKKLYPEF